jgi:microcystin-dependent protein
MTIKIQGDKITFPDDSEQTTAYNGSSGGGIPEAPVDGKQYGRQDATWTEVTGGGSTPTPEALVWEDKLAERDMDVEYTNSYDTPLLLSIGVYTAETNGYATMLIDGANFGAIGHAESDNTTYDVVSFTVPSGSKYKLSKGLYGIANKASWHEAKMPVAIGVPSVDTAIGMVAPFAMDSVPTGWLHCDGSAVSRTTYSLLYSKIGDTYGVGDGSTTFNLPDLQDEFIRGSSDTLPVGNKQDDEFKAHTHLVGGSASKVATNSNQAKFPGSATIDSSSTGGEETRPRNVAMLYCINATAEPSSGGGTPEAMVWEDKTADREYGTLYTNTNDVPLYVQVYINVDGKGNYIQAVIDGQSQGYAGNGAGGTTDGVNSLVNPLYIIPAGKTYKIDLTGADGGTIWKEAKMPVGGSGGGTAEPMVWENKKAERAYDTVYTNTKDCPIYVQPYLERNSTDRMYVQFKIDGDLVWTEGGEAVSFSSPMFVVPSGSTYELEDTVTGTALKEWFEANVSGGSASGGGSGTPSSFARIVDEKPEGTQAGDAVAGNNIRDLNTVVYDKDNIVTVAGNAFTLQEGTYVIDYSAPTHMVNSHKVSLRNITDGESVSQGSSEYSANASNSPASVGDNRSFGKYVVTLTKPTTYQLNHYAQIAKTGNGLGISTVSQGAPNVYATVDIQKVGTGGSGDSYWTESGNDLFYKSSNFDSGLYLNSQENNNMNIVGYNGTDACDLWIRSAGAPNSGLGIKSDGSVQVKGAGNTDVRITAPSGQYATYIADNGDQKYAMQIRPDQANAFVVRNETSGSNSLLIKTDGIVGLPSIKDTVQTPNVYVDGGGDLYKSTTATYSAEEVDKKLAIKDKLIEKLSARLDELEKRVK